MQSKNRISRTIFENSFSDTDLSIIRQRRGPANRLGFAVQLCYLAFLASS